MDNMEFLWNNLTDKTDSGLTRYDTKMLQGLSVLAMVVLHLFDRVDFQGLFAFCSGYGLYKKYMCVGGKQKNIIMGD